MVTPVKSEPDMASATIASLSRGHIVAAAVALVAGLILGLGAGVLWPKLTQPRSDSVEAGFARDMSTHHAQAVEMGMIAYAGATDRDVRFMGRDIALTQQGQIGLMQGWLRQWNLDPTGSEPPMSWMPDGAWTVRDGLMPGMATPEEIKALREAKGTAVDLQFLRLMQQHHLGGIHMAQAVLDHSDDEEEVREFAQLMLNGQQRELTDIKSLLDRLSVGS